MSKMVIYKIKLPKGEVTIDQLLQVMEVMGLNPILHNNSIEVESFTTEDSAYGNLEFDTSVLGGSVRQKKGVASVRFNPKTRVIEGGLQLAIDSWGINSRVDEMTQNMGQALKDLVETINKVAEATKKTTFTIPGLTAEEVTQVFLALGGRMATRDLVEGGTGNEHLPNLAASYLHRRQKLIRSRTPATETPEANLTDLLQIGSKPKVFNVEVPAPGGRKLIKLGYVPPVAAIKKVKGGVEVTLPEIFLPGCEQQLENVRRLGLALRATEAQAKQHVGTGKPIPHVEVNKGSLAKFQIDWEKPAVPTSPLSTTAQEAFAERAAAIKSGEVQVSLEEQMSIMAQAETPAPISTAALKDQVITQARDAGIAQFVYA